jgi:hypothetical protein
MIEGKASAAAASISDVHDKDPAFASFTPNPIAGFRSQLIEAFEQRCALVVRKLAD